MLTQTVKKSLGFSLLGLLLTLPAGAYAQPFLSGPQLSFKIDEGVQQNTYSYRWLDNTSQIRSVSFKLDRALIEKSIDEFKPIDFEDLREFKNKAILAYVAMRNKQGVPIKATLKNRGLMLEAPGTFSQQALDKEMETLKDLGEQAEKAYLKNRYFDLFEEFKFRPDYVRIAEDYREKLEPLSNALVGQTMRYEFRERVNLILSFFQSIPYDTLEDRDNSNGSGFATPIELLHQNLGDCDTKTTAFASIMREMYYRIPMIMVFIPGHAFVGLATEPLPDDVTLEVKGRTYVLSEPVGPALMPFGQITPDSAAKLREQDYHAVTFDTWSLD